MTGSTEKRLLKYALLFKKGIIIGIFCLMIATALELAGPFIAKRVIDHHILGIEGVWHEVATDSHEKTVNYDNRLFVRNDRLKDKSKSMDEVTVIAIGKDYYFIEEPVPLVGSRKVVDGEIVIGKENPVKVSGNKLALSDIYSFFKLEKKQILLLFVLYLILFIVVVFF